MNQISSKYLERAVSELSKLPGIGKKSALRLALHLLRQDEREVNALGNSIISMKAEIKFCKRCHNISDDDYCTICNSKKRETNTICVVSDINDIIAIENTGEYNGLYHVLGGVISPMDGVGPQDLNLISLLDRIENESISEILLALPTTVEGDTTNFYIFKKVSGIIDRITVLARGVSIGDSIEYIDEVTLGRSIINRMPYTFN